MELQNMRTSNLITAIVVALFIVACKKERKKEDGISTFTVVEAITKTPLTGASVIPRACLSRDNGWCGQETPIGAIGTVTTNSEGVATLSGVEDLNKVKVTKEKYWESHRYFPAADQPPSTTIELYPIATLEIHLVKQNSHPNGAKLIVTSPFELCENCSSEQFIFDQLKDTTIYMRGHGNIKNNVLWGVTAGGPALLAESPSVMVNRFDTAQIEIRY